MASDSQRIITLEGQVRKLMASVMAFQGQPADATLSIPHNDSFPFEDNVDATHPANLRYVISKNVTRVVSARLSIFMAPYRTYNTATGVNTGIESANHSHGHDHTQSISGPSGNPAITSSGASGASSDLGFAGSAIFTQHFGGVNSVGQSNDHTHPLNITQTLGVTEGTTATGVAISFDGVDATAALGGPFNADVIELDVRRYIQVKVGIKHTIAMQPSGNGRIEAFLRLGCYVSAGQTL